MKYHLLHPWNVAPKEAVEIQRRLRDQVMTHNDFDEIKTVAGADVAFEGDRGYAGVIIYRYPDLVETERQYTTARIEFPYIPGLLAFREIPILLRAFEKIKEEPDLVIFDGQGIAHPRGLGIAAHMGLVLDKPTIGCAKSRLFGDHAAVGEKRGDYTPLFDGSRTIGVVLRTRDHVAPIYVSPGHRISLETSIEVVMKCLASTRIPKPTREADYLVAKIKKDLPNFHS